MREHLMMTLQTDVEKKALNLLEKRGLSSDGQDLSIGHYYRELMRLDVWPVSTKVCCVRTQMSSLRERV